MKYIDADRLREELQKPKTELKVGNYYLDNSEQAVGYENALIDFELLIDSLQQEQQKQKKNCNDCPHCVDRKDQFGWHFKGCFGGPYNGKFIAEIDECPLQQEQPSLPSNLDEAEFEYVQSLDEIPANQEEENMIYDAFKAGAKWMAKQGVSIPAHIFMPCEIKDVYDSSKGEYPAAIHPDCGGSLVLERYLKDFKHNEEVIMQIRKKEE